MDTGFIESNVVIPQYESFCTLESPTLSILRAVEITGQLIANKTIISEKQEFLDVAYRFGAALIYYKPDSLFEAWLMELIAMLEAVCSFDRHYRHDNIPHDLRVKLKTTIDELNAFVERLKLFPCCY